MPVNEATPNQFPFQILITVDGASQCQGILISPEWVLTTANGLRNKSAVEMLFGGHSKANLGNPFDTGASPYQVKMSSTDLLIHENYNPSSFANDVGLIRLPNPLSLNAGIQPLTRLNRAENLTGQAVKSVGWGVYLEGYVKTTDIPQVVEAFIADMQVAINLFGQQYNHPGQIAVDIQGATIRTSTLITSDPNGWQLVGLSSFGAISIGGGPEVYSSIAYFAEWIRQNSGVVFN